jgi:hypothetical protein
MEGVLGRLSKFTPRRRKSIISALKRGLTRAEAGERVHVAERTIADWLQRGREEPDSPWEAFLLDVEQAEREARVASQEPSRPWRGMWVQLTWNPDEAITYPPGLEGEALEDAIQGHLDTGRLVLAADGIVRPRELHERYFRWVASGRPDDDSDAAWFIERERESGAGRWTAQGRRPAPGEPFTVVFSDGQRLEVGGEAMEDRAAVEALLADLELHFLIFHTMSELLWPN